MCPIKYVHDAVRNGEAHLPSILPKRADNPSKMGYDPELGVSPELEPDAAFLRQMTELGRIDTKTEAHYLLSHLALPRQEHLDATQHVMTYVGQ